MEDIERIKDRLENIQSVEPIIASLRTIAAGGWRLALKHAESAARFTENVAEVLATVAAKVSSDAMLRANLSLTSSRVSRALMLVITSERGLCGSFNDIVLEGADRLIAQQRVQSDEVLVATLGGRAESYFHARNRPLLFSQPLPVTRVASYEMVRDLGSTLIEVVKRREADAVYVIYSPYRPMMTVPPVSRRWIPADPTVLPRLSGDTENGERGVWPLPIIETHPTALFERAAEEWMYARLYQYVIESAAGEQAARFRAMDAASSNLSRIIEELTLSYHTARQHTITMEMLDLVAGSGLLRDPTRHRGAH